MNESLVQRVRQLPRSCGVYLIKDRRSSVIYVGKARNIRSRMLSHLRAGDNPREQALMSKARDVEFIVTPDEVEALILEATLIKEYSPRYNVNLKDDKKYPYLKVTVNEAFPRLILTRLLRKDGARYFGPFVNVKSIRLLLKNLRTIFPMRTCRNLNAHVRQRRACLDYHIGKCPAPCLKEIDEERYGRIVDRLIMFLSGKEESVVRALSKEMERASAERDFERAALIRDRIAAIRTVQKTLGVVDLKEPDCDVIGLASGSRNAAAVVLKMRSGKLIEKENYLLSRLNGLEEGDVLSSFMSQYYLRQSRLPRTVFVPWMPPDRVLLETWLERKRGGRVKLSSPGRGHKAQLLDMANDNARLALAETGERLESPEDIDRSRALGEVRTALGLGRNPRRMEGYDISTIFGKQTVGSMVVFLDGMPERAAYRRFRVTRARKPDDCAALEEVLSRRLGHLSEKEWDEPDLILIDGGKGQLAAAQKALDRYRCNRIPLVALAKKEEELFLPGRRKPLRLARNSEALKLLQRVRDEAHRYALTYHRKLREKRMVATNLELIPGIGWQRRKNLLNSFGSLDSLRLASVQDLEKVPGIGRRLATAIHEYFHSPA